MNGAKRLTTTLTELGVDTVFGYPGGAIMPVYDALPVSLRHILCRHEQGAAFAAQGYARVTGKPGVCIATSGPGATNLVTGIADAWMDSIPMLAITGQVPQALIGTNAFQEIDIVAMTRGVVKASFQLTDADDIEAITRYAYGLAASGRPGPVLIDIPKDIQLSDVDGTGNWQPPSCQAPRHSNAELDAAIALINGAKRPVLMTGGGVKAAGARSALIALAEKLHIPVTTTLNGIGLLPKDHPQNLGMLGMHGASSTNDRVQAADLIIGLGVRFDDRATGKVEGFAPNAKIIHVDVDAKELGKNVETTLAIHADVAGFIDALLSSASLEAHQHACAEHSTPPDNVQCLRPRINVTSLLSSLDTHLDDDTYVTVDVGQHQMWTAQAVPFRHAGQFMTSGGLGTMGFGLPAAVGVQIAKPEARVINITGDGSFMMNVQELATANRYQLPIKIIVINNSHLGLVRQQQELFYGERYSEVDLSDNPDFGQLASVFGFSSHQIEHDVEVASALDWLVRCDGPALLEVQVPHQQNVWPFVVPGETNDVRLENTPYFRTNGDEPATMSGPH